MVVCGVTMRVCLQGTLKPLDVQQTKDLETTVAGIRADKVKEKTASDAAKKGELPAMLRRLLLNGKRHCPFQPMCCLSIYQRHAGV